MDALVSSEWLARELDAPDLRILDASYHALDPARDPKAEFLNAHLPGAIHLDLAGLADPDSKLPGTVPSAERFAERVGALGVSEGDRIVLYDASAHRTAARAWWMFRLFGARNVAVLDGGFNKWKAEGRPLEEGPGKSHPPATFHAAPDRALLRSFEDMRRIVEQGGEQVLDARSAARFTGEEADPRGQVASGHMPGARNLPYNRVLLCDGTFRAKDEVAKAFAEAGIDLSKPLVTTCGSGVTAAVLLFAANLLGKRDTALYDGSWSEWGADPSTPKALGA